MRLDDLATAACVGIEPKSSPSVFAVSEAHWQVLLTRHLHGHSIARPGHRMENNLSVDVGAPVVAAFFLEEGCSLFEQVHHTPLFVLDAVHSPPTRQSVVRSNAAPAKESITP